MNMPDFTPSMTIGEKYGPAMTIEDQADADAYFAALVEHTMVFRGRSREEAERIERSNLGYYAGYCDALTRARVERLFACQHPIFGPIAERGQPSPWEAFAAGWSYADRMQRRTRDADGGR